MRCQRRGFDPWVREILWSRNVYCYYILAWEIPWTEEPGGIQSMRSLKTQTELRTHTCTESCTIYYSLFRVVLISLTDSALKSGNLLPIRSPSSSPQGFCTLSVGNILSHCWLSLLLALLKGYFQWRIHFPLYLNCSTISTQSPSPFLIFLSP